MSKVTLEIEMPENCVKCPMGNNKSIPLETFVICNLVHRGAFEEAEEGRPKWCPLHETEDAAGKPEVPETAKAHIMDRFTNGGL